jgi:hypothetical protein
MLARNESPDISVFTAPSPAALPPATACGGPCWIRPITQHAPYQRAMSERDQGAVSAGVLPDWDCQLAQRASSLPFS